MPRSSDPVPATRNAPRPGRLNLEALENRDCPNAFTVTGTSDDGSVGTLRWAVAQVNAHTGADTIDFASTVHSITLSGTQLELSDNVGTTTITGPGVTVDGGGRSRVFQVDANVSASFSGLTITGGSVTGNGAGLYNLGTTALTDCTVTGNHAVGVSGSTDNGLGGGVANDTGTLELTNCTISDNTADLAGGGVASSGTPGSGKGSAIPGQVTMTACTVTGNAAGAAGGVLNGVPLISGTGKDATVKVGPTELTMENCAVSNNRALGADGTLGDALAGASGFGVVNASTAALTDSTISGNDGGGILNLGIGSGKSSTASTATLDVTDCTVKGNLASDPAVGGGLSASGFGVVNLSIAALTNSAISGNDGGGVFTGVAGSGKGSTNPVLEMVNCTVSQHLAVSGVSDTGYGVVHTGGTAALTNNTISGNDGGVDNMSTTTALSNTIVAGNTSADLSGTGFSGSNNLIGTGGSAELMDGVNGNIVGVAASDLHLGALNDNGGPTQTMALLPGSPAIDKGAPVVFTTLTVPIADAVATSITVASTKGVGIGLYVQIDGEILRITGVTAATTLTVVRGQLGSNATAHNTTPTNVTLAADQRGLSPYTGAPDIGAYEFVPNVVSVTVSPASAVEGGTTILTYTFARTGDTAGALAVNLTIAGTAAFSADYTATSPDAGFTFDGTNGTVTFAAGSSMATVVLAPVNDTLVEGSETADLTVATGTDYDIGTPSAASGTIADNDTATISIAATSTVTEQGGAQTVTVALTTSDGAGGTATLAPGVTLTADVVDAGTGTAISGTDYTAFGTPTVTFGPGSTDGDTQAVTLAPINDTLVEGNETVNLTLQNLNTIFSGQASLGNTGAVATIDDNDTATLSIVATATAPEQSGPKTITVTLVTSDGAGGTATLAPGVTVTADVVDAGGGTATSGADYTAFGTQQVSFGPGGTDGDTRIVALTPTNDTLFENDETVKLRLQNVSALDGQTALGSVNSAVTITSNDPPPTVSLSVSGGSFAESGGAILVTATLNTPSSLPTTVNLGFGGTAGFGTDYTASGTSVVIPAGELSASFTLTGRPDTQDEQDETVTASIIGITNGTAGASASATALLTDDDSGLFAAAQGAGGQGLVHVYDANNALIRIFAPFPGWTGEVHVATGDVTGDGTSDVIVGAGPGALGHVKVFDGASGAEIRSFYAFLGFNGGVQVGAGDIDGDGFADIIVGASVNGHLKVFSGLDNSLLRSFYAFPGYGGDVSVAGGDVNGDKLADILVASGPGTIPHIKAFGGVDGALLRSFLVLGPGFPGGAPVTADAFSVQISALAIALLPGVSLAAGDTNGDGFADIVVGSSSLPLVRVYDGATGGQVAGFDAFSGFSGGVRVGTSDRNGDGRADILVGAGPGAFGGHVKALQGTTRAELASFFTFDPSFIGGIYVG